MDFMKRSDKSASIVYIHLNLTKKKKNYVQAIAWRPPAAFLLFLSS